MEKITVVGVEMMGIAYAGALGGFEVRLQDIEEEAQEIPAATSTSTTRAAR